MERALKSRRLRGGDDIGLFDFLFGSSAPEIGDPERLKDALIQVPGGFHGECPFQSREAEKAIPQLEQVLRTYQEIGDREGVVAYLGSLYEVHRYLGQSEAAAGCAERLAAALADQGQSVEANRYRRQAGIVRAGEPLNRVVALIDGVRHELDDAGTVENKRVQLVFERNRITLRPAEERTRGGETGQPGPLLSRPCLL